MITVRHRFLKYFYIQVFRFRIDVDMINSISINMGRLFNKLHKISFFHKFLHRMKLLHVVPVHITNQNCRYLRSILGEQSQTMQTDFHTLLLSLFVDHVILFMVLKTNIDLTSPSPISVHMVCECPLAIIHQQLSSIQKELQFQIYREK